MLFSGKNKDSGINANSIQNKQPLSIEEQLLLFQNMQTSLRQVKQQTDEAERVKDSVARIRSVIFIQPEMDHNCSTTTCGPISEATLVARRILGGTPIHPDVFVCRYGRHHVCNSRYRECVIVMDNTQQCTCRITGRFYGLSGSWQIGGGGSVATDDVASAEGDDFFPDESANIIDDEDGMVAEKKLFTFDDYALDGADLGGGGGGGGGGSDGECDYEGTHGNSYHPFNPPTAFNQVMHNNNSKFISKSVDANAPIESTAVQATANTVAMVLGPNIQSLRSTTITTTTTTTTTTKKRDVRATIIQTSSSGGRPSKRARTLVTPPAPKLHIASSPITQLQTVTPDQLNIVIKTEYKKRREDIQEIINCLFYSAKRTQVGNAELRGCMDNAKKAVSGTIRTIRDRQIKHLPVVIPLYDIMVTYYTHITVAHTLLTVAPQNPTFIEQVINIIMFLWRRVVKFHLTHNMVYIKQTFIQHCLAIFYEMRKGGRILKDSEIIPDSAYIRMYMPSIELIEQFGYKKNFITLGFKMLLQAYKD